MSPQERQKLAREESEILDVGDIIEVISDDPRMPKVAPKMAESIGTIECIDVKEEGGLYHGYFRRIELISLIDARGYVKIAKIDGGAEVKNELKNYFIEIGKTVEVLERGVSHKHLGPLIVKINKKDILIPGE